MSSSPSPDYAALPARELDALVAERITGWHHVGPFGSTDAWGLPPPATSLTFENLRIVPRYSTDLATMLEVARAMARKGFSYHFRLIPDTDKHEAGFIFGEHSWLTRTADSPARALCLAALAALAPASPAAGKERAK